MNKENKLDKAIYSKCLNGYELIEYNGNKDGDWFHNEYCHILACVPTPYQDENIEYIDGAWRDKEYYEEVKVN